MITRKQLHIFLTLMIFWAIAFTVGITQVARADSLLLNGSLAVGDVVEDDVFTYGQKVTIDGVINGDVFIVGNQVQVNGTINGSLFVIGQQVVIQGEVSGTTYTAAVSLELKPEAVLAQNLYFVGVSLTTFPGSVIERDLKTVCLSADLKGSVARDTLATIGILKLIELITNRLGVELWAPQSNLLPSGGLSFGTASSLITTTISSVMIQESPPVAGIDSAQLQSWLIDLLREFGVLFILGAVCYWLFREPINCATQALRSRPLAALGYGLLALLIAFNIFLVGLLVAGLIFAFGLWLGNLGLWSFTLFFWALTFAALVFFMAALWFLVAYGTKLIVAYLVGTWLFEKILPNKAVPHFVGLAIGVLIYVLLNSIAMLGWVIGVLVTAWGLGAVWLARLNWRAPRISTSEATSEAASKATPVDLIN